MRKILLVSLLALLIATLYGCAQRSISDSGYPGDPRTKNPSYSGELSEMAVLGFPDGSAISETDTKKAFENRQDVTLAKDESLIGIPSGAVSSGEEMLDDQKQVSELKKKAYSTLVSELVRYFLS